MSGEGYNRGEMDISEQKDTWSGFMFAAKWGTVSIFALVLFLTVFLS